MEEGQTKWEIQTRPDLPMDRTLDLLLDDKSTELVRLAQLGRDILRKRYSAFDAFLFVSESKRKKKRWEFWMLVVCAVVARHTAAALSIAILSVCRSRCHALQAIGRCKSLFRDSVEQTLGSVLEDTAPTLTETFNVESEM